MQPAIESLSIDEKRSLLASLVGQTHLPLQLSTTQERLWQLCQLRPDTAIFNFQTSLELQGGLLPEVLEAAALRVVLRHKILQVCYGTAQGKPALSLAPIRPITIARHDLRDLSPAEQQARMERLGMEDSQGSFDLSRPPLLRLTLARLAPDKHRLYLTMHHIVSDFLSLDLFLFELGEFYSAALASRSTNLPPLTADYQDFAKLERSLGTDVGEGRHLEYWRRALDGTKPIEWFSDHVRPAVTSGKAATEFFNLPTSLMQQVDACARQEKVTPYMVLLAGFNILLHAYSGEQDLVVGSPMAGRIRSAYESLIGMFSYPVLMRTSISASQEFRGLLQLVRRVVLEAAEHGGVPFAKVADASGRPGSQAALLRAMFSYVSRLRPMNFEGLLCRRRPTDRGVTDLDLFLTVFSDQGEWHGVLEYNTDLFEPDRIRHAAAAYVDILQAAIVEPELAVRDLAARVPVKPPARLNIAATFTADPVLDVLRFWSRELDLQLTPVIAPYNQLFQQLLDPLSPLLSASSALNVLLVRPEDWIRDVEPVPDRQKDLLRRSTRELIAAVRSAMSRMNCPLKIYLCPASPEAQARSASAIAEAAQSIHEALDGTNGIEVFDAQHLAERYSVAEVHDPQADRIAHIPYKPGFYTALGTAISRHLRVQLSHPCKVLVLDCDNTLWQGLCAEAGALGVMISEGHRDLQRFVVEQAASGVLICLNSKNAPEHVLAVFRENPAMILKESDLSAYRINWEPKSSNLESLASQLQLGLESFVFIDDDARECAEIAARCPQVLALRAPQEAPEFRRFIEHLWILDRGDVSEEDRRRARFYRDNQQRDLALRESSSLDEFLATLELRVDVRPAALDEISRIAQLSQRTNQFNASGVVFNALELQRILQENFEIAAVEVSDRFGEYGLVGAVVYRNHEPSLTVAAFYLSCRVLGRGVEQRILAELGRTAAAAGLSNIHIHYKESFRNQAFRRFLDRLLGRLEMPVHGPGTFVMTVADATRAEEAPLENLPAGTPERKRIDPCRRVSSRNFATLALLPHELSTSAQILDRIQASTSRQRELRSTRAFAFPQGELENAIACEWSIVLRLDNVGRNDNFFEIGGNSLLFVQLNGNLITRLGLAISMTQMFQYPTVASLAAHMAGQKMDDRSTESSVRSAKTRAVLEKRRRQFPTRQVSDRAFDNNSIQF